MRKKFRKSSATFSGSIARISLWSILFGIVLLCVIVLYYWLLHPVISKHFLKPSIHTGIEVYENQLFMEFESGSRFVEVAHFAKELMPSGEVVDFYHIDNRIQDNPIHGKMHDLFSLDFQLDQQNYLQVKEVIERDCRKLFYSVDDYEIYASGFKTNRDDDYVFFALCDLNQVVRCILVTDPNYPPTDSYNYWFILKQPYLNWYSNKTGDGL